MGFTSFLTADGQESIRNRYTGEHRTVYFLQPNGKTSIKEDAYEGYGEFNGVDVFIWLAEHNLPETLNHNTESLRDRGCMMENSECKYPLKFSFDKDAVYENLPASEYDPSQGFF